MHNIIFCGCAQVCTGSCFFVRAQPFLSFPYVSKNTQFLVTSNDTGWEWLMLFTSKQRYIYMATLWFRGFGLEHAVPIHPIFEPCPLNANVARWWNVHICQYSNTLTWINVFKRSSSNPESLPERGVSLISKRSSSKWENHFLAVLSPMALYPYTTPQMFLTASAAFAPLFNSEEYVGNVQISPLGTPFSSVHGSTRYLQMTKL